MAKLAQVSRTFGNIHHPVKDRVIFSIHGRKQPSWPFHERAIQDQIPATGQVTREDGGMFQTVVDNPLEGFRTVATLGCQLADGVAFHHPSSEPNLLAISLKGTILPTKRITAVLTKPPLSACPGAPVPVNGNRTTTPTGSFSSSFLNQFKKLFSKIAKTMNLHAHFPTLLDHYAQNDNPSYLP